MKMAPNKKKSIQANISTDSFKTYHQCQIDIKVQNTHLLFNQMKGRVTRKSSHRDRRLKIYRVIMRCLSLARRMQVRDEELPPPCLIRMKRPVRITCGRISKVISIKYRTKNGNKNTKTQVVLEANSK